MKGRVGEAVKVLEGGRGFVLVGYVFSVLALCLALGVVRKGCVW